MKTAAFDALPIAAALMDSDGVILSVNESWRKASTVDGLPVPGLGVGQNYVDSFAAQEDTALGRVREAIEGIRAVLLGQEREFVMDYPRPTKIEPRWQRITVTPIHRSRSHCAMIMHVDITAQKVIEQNLQKQEAQYLVLLNAAKEGIVALDARGICTFCNDAAARLLGYEEPNELVGEVFDQQHRPSHSSYAVIPFGDFKTESPAGKISHVDHAVFLRRDNTRFPVEFWSYPLQNEAGFVGAIVTFFDITDQLHIESELRHSQKMEVVGRLAGGVAHDFRNALSVITGYSQILEERLAADDDGRKYARKIGMAAERAANFTRQLLGFNRKEPLKPSLLDLNLILRDMEEMLRRMAGDKVDLTAILAPDLEAIRADPGQIEQILLNLVANARDAMPQGGELVIQTSTVTADGYINLSVTDNGIGMDTSTRERIFEPFFTTKDPGKGTGLGLSTVRDIVTQNGGQIFVNSQVGLGTSFQVYLPIALGDPGPILPEQLPISVPRVEIRRLVEDDDAFRGLPSQ